MGNAWSEIYAQHVQARSTRFTSLLQSAIRSIPAENQKTEPQGAVLTGRGPQPKLCVCRSVIPAHDAARAFFLCQAKGGAAARICSSGPPRRRIETSNSTSVSSMNPTSGLAPSVELSAYSFARDAIPTHHATPISQPVDPLSMHTCETAYRQPRPQCCPEALTSFSCSWTASDFSTPTCSLLDWQAMSGGHTDSKLADIDIDFSHSSYDLKGTLSFGELTPSEASFPFDLKSPGGKRPLLRPFRRRNGFGQWSRQDTDASEDSTAEEPDSSRNWRSSYYGWRRGAQAAAVAVAITLVCNICLTIAGIAKTGSFGFGSTKSSTGTFLRG